MLVFLLAGCGGGGGTTTSSDSGEVTTCLSANVSDACTNDSSSTDTGSGGGETASPSIGEIANYYFYYTISTSDFDDRVTIDALTDMTTDDGSQIYSGYNADNSSYLAVMAWSPSLNSYVTVLETTLNDTYWAFVFNPGTDNALSGTYYQQINGSISGSGYSLNSSISHRYASGTWARSASGSTIDTAGNQIQISHEDAVFQPTDLDPDIQETFTELSDTLAILRR